MFPQKNNAQTFSGTDVILSHVELLPPVKSQADGNLYQSSTLHATPPSWHQRKSSKTIEIRLSTALKIYLSSANSTIMKFSVLLVLTTLSAAVAWVPSIPTRSMRASRSSLQMAIDYNDPVVAEEFAKVQPLSYEEVEAELQESGVRASAAMNEMEVKLMLLEMRLRNDGKLGGKEQKKRPLKFSSKLEEARWTKPVFEALYLDLKEKDDINSMNVVAEYMNDREIAIDRYAKTYKGLLRKVDKSLTAPPPVTSPTLQFSGFPANMKEAGCRMTLGALGTIVEFECEEEEDLPVLKGKVTFEDIESAKAAVKQYHGMDMGMGTKLEFKSV
jgi:hypothetical protein